MTVADLRKIIENVPDEALVVANLFSRVDWVEQQTLTNEAGVMAYVDRVDHHKPDGIAGHELVVRLGKQFNY